MKTEDLKALQAPLKKKYGEDPESAVITLHASGKLSEGISCKVDTGRALTQAGLHPATGGDGTMLCSGDLLLEALVACAGVTLNAVATSIGITIREGTVRAEGDLDFMYQKKFRWASKTFVCILSSIAMPTKRKSKHF